MRGDVFERGKQSLVQGRNFGDGVPVAAVFPGEAELAFEHGDSDFPDMAAIVGRMLVLGGGIGGETMDPGVLLDELIDAAEIVELQLGGGGEIVVAAEVAQNAIPDASVGDSTKLRFDPRDKGSEVERGRR